MKLHFFKNAFDNVVTDDASMDLSFEELCQFFDERLIVVSKGDVPLFIAATFDTSATARPAVHILRNLDGSIKEERPILGPDGQPRPGRYADNVTSISALVLDYDGGAKIADVQDQLTNLQHLGYTSHSHRKDGQVEKFRIILPFDQPCPKAEWVRRRHHIEALFPGVDPRTIDTARAFYLPSCPPERQSTACKWAIDGVPFNWRVLDPRPTLPHQLPAQRTNLVGSGSGRIVYESFDMVRFFKDQGLYLRPSGQSKHEVRCPHIPHADGGTVIWQTGRGWPSFYCAHTKCQTFDFYAHYRQTLGAGWMKPYCMREPELSARSVAEALRAKGPAHA